MFNTTFNYISVTTFMAEIGVHREIHRPVASHIQTFYRVHDGSSSVKMKGNCFIDIDGIYEYHCL